MRTLGLVLALHQAQGIHAEGQVRAAMSFTREGCKGPKI